MKLLVLITVFCFYISTTTSVLPDCGRIPPNFWCKNMQIATHCGVAAACQRYNQLSANRKVHIQIIMESLCPFCQRFIVDKFYHDVYLKFRGYVDVELVPYGNAERNVSGKWAFIVFSESA
uniref:Saposin A-type domain-containing protein n=1 Tax=Bursaphelenchus xylophilus TaxID=6326 RepID=A0A1I7SRM6_BURXY